MTTKQTLRARSHKMRLSMLLVALVVPFCLGCGSLLKIERTEQTPIPQEPRKPVELEEAVRRQAAYAADVLQAVWALGVEAHNQAVGQAVQAAAFVEATLGGPAERLRVILKTHVGAVRDTTLRSTASLRSTRPPLPAIAPNLEHADALEEAQAALAEYRDLLALYAQDLDAARAEAAGLRPAVEVSSGWLRWITGLGWLAMPILLLALLVLVPNQVLVMLAGSLVRALRALLGELFLRATHALDQVVEGVQRGKMRMGAEAADSLGQELLCTTSPTTRKIVARIKEDVKDRLRKEG